MNKVVNDFMNAKNSLMKYFKCEQDFFIKVVEGHTWLISEDEGIFFLTYWNAENERKDAVIVGRGGAPMIFRAAESTMVIAIDCVKIAFILKNEYEKKS